MTDKNDTQQLKAKIEALQVKLKDLENENNSLRDQQRNVRFLLKTFAKELNLKIAARSQVSTGSLKTLSYRDDGELTELVSRKDAAEVLAYVDAKDAGNLVLTGGAGVKAKAALKAGAWKVAGASMRVGYKTAKKGYRLLKGKK